MFHAHICQNRTDVGRPAPLLMVDAALIGARHVHDRLPPEIRERIPEELREKISGQA